MFFDNIAKKWSKNCPENAPSVPTPSVHQMASAQPVGVSSAAAKGQKFGVFILKKGAFVRDA
jgi:hypothetical protein